METSHLRHFCTLSQEAKGVLTAAMEELKFSARAHDKILKVSRSIADLAGSDNIEAEHIRRGRWGYRSLGQGNFLKTVSLRGALFPATKPISFEKLEATICDFH